MAKKRITRKKAPVKKVKYNIKPNGEVKIKKPIIHQLETPPEIKPMEVETPSYTNVSEVKPEIKTETVIETPIVSTPVQVETLSSDSMLNDLMGETDKDSEPENNSDNDLLNDLNSDTEIKTETSSQSTEPKTETTTSDKIYDTLTTDNEDWQNPSDFRKMCAVNAMMYVEGGAILLSFIGQLISGDWTPEGEKRYTPSEERRKLIRNPLAKKFELNKDHSKSTPTGALITAIIFTILPIVIIAFKDRKSRIEMEKQNIENIRLKKELQFANDEINAIRSQGVNIPKQTEGQIKKPLSKFLHKRGRHKKDCDCEKCNMKRMKSK